MNNINNNELFKRVAIINQYCVNEYRIGHDFPSFKLAIKHDDYGHEDEDVGH